MKLTDFDIYRYVLPFKEPISLKGKYLHSREGFLVKLTDETGASGWGETSPLPEFSRETLDEAGRQLYEIASSFLGVTLPRGPFVRDRGELAPSVRFGFELAAYNVHAKADGKSLPELLSQDSAASVSLNGLLVGSEEKILDEARRMGDAGYEAVKLKVGSRSVANDAGVVKAVSGVLGNDVVLRLDANRAWSFEEAVDFFQAGSGVSFDYVEEPLADPDGLSRLAEEYGVPVALDETLVGMRREDLREHRYARAIVMKPTLLGGISRTLELAWEAERLGILPVVSSAYETGVGTSALVSLAASIGDGNIPAGLDTYRRLAADVFEPALDLSYPHVSVEQVAMRRNLNHELLQLVYSSGM